MVQTTTQPVILGIDPGYDRIGWAIGTPNGNVAAITDFGCIQTQKTDQIEQRYQDLEDQLLAIIHTYHPTQLAIETLFFSKNTTTALKVAEARGVTLSCCYRNGLEIYQYNPNTIKLATTGNGRANKTAMEKMVRLQLQIPDKPIIDDAIDALAIVLTHTVTRR